jgi:nitroimidazol reductase NimA-like FMN-containing flavoprotein (pyridoxamine 5'-phosphate oxidase superfamily)
MVIHELSDEECLTAIAETRFGRLGCARDNQPYVVPIYYAYRKGADGASYLYSFTTVGQKVDWMRGNPQVCVEWDDVERYDRWTSVIAFGRYEELMGDPGAGRDEEDLGQEVHRAYKLLRERSTTWWQPGSAAFNCRTHCDPAQLWSPIYYRIRIDRMSGRRADPQSPGAVR